MMIDQLISSGRKTASGREVFAVTLPASPWVMVYDAHTFEVIASLSALDQFSPSNVPHLAFNNSGTMLAVSFIASPCLAIFDTATWDLLPTPETTLSNLGMRVVWNNTGTRLLHGGLTSPYFLIYDTETWETVAKPETTPPGGILSAIWSGDDSKVIICGIADSVSGTVQAYNTADWSVITEAVAAFDAGTDVSGDGAAWTPGETQLVLSHDQGTAGIALSVFNTSDWSQVTDPVDYPLYDGEDVSISPDGETLALACGGTPFIFLYNLSDMTKIADPAVLPDLTGHETSYSVSFRQDGRALAVGHDAGVILYDPNDWSVITEFTSPTSGAVLCCRFGMIANL